MIVCLHVGATRKYVYVQCNIIICVFHNQICMSYVFHATNMLKMCCYVTLIAENRFGGYFYIFKK